MTTFTLSVPESQTLPKGTGIYTSIDDQDGERGPLSARHPERIEFARDQRQQSNEFANDAVGEEESWGYIDKMGRLAIWMQFNEAVAFDDGVAKVHVGGTYALVEDHPGWWEGGEWILIDRTGKKRARLYKDEAQ